MLFDRLNALISLRFHTRSAEHPPCGLQNKHAPRERAAEGGERAFLVEIFAGPAVSASETSANEDPKKGARRTPIRRCDR